MVLLATNTLGTLYILENGNAVKSVADLKGKTILASGKGGTPEYILNQVLDAAGLDPAADVTIKWLTSHADVATALAAEAGAIGMLPQPFVTVVTTKQSAIRVPLDLGAEWQKATGTVLPMGVLIAQKILCGKPAGGFDRVPGSLCSLRGEGQRATRPLHRSSWPSIKSLPMRRWRKKPFPPATSSMFRPRPGRQIW